MKAGTSLVCKFLREIYNVNNFDYSEGVVKIVRFEIPGISIQELRDRWNDYCEYLDLNGGNVSFVYTENSGDLISAVIS